VALLLFLLQSCSAGNQPFQKSAGNNASVSGRTAPPLTLRDVQGIPEDKAKLFKEMLALAAAERDIAIVEGAFSDSFWLSGVFRMQKNTAGSVVSYQWRLDDGAGSALHSFSGVEQAGVASGDAWGAVFPDVLRRIASATTENLASKLAQMGYATRTAGLPPPALSFLVASKREAGEIDLETLLGPAAVTTAQGGEAVASHSQQQVYSAAAPPDATKPARRREEIRAIALTSVVGSPAGGDAELRNALKTVLVNAGWPVVDSPRGDALTVTGRVSIEAPQAGRQAVVLAWNVRAPSGHDLGTVRQSNAVSAGSLENGWAETATPVAEAAALGLFDLVGKLR
jgi:hypothetical protein